MDVERKKKRIILDLEELEDSVNYEGSLAIREIIKKLEELYLYEN